MNDNFNDGYEVPLHRALTEPILLGGVPREIAILNGTFAAGFVLGLQMLYAIPIFFIIHIVAVFFTKKDPQFFDVFRRHITQKSYYDT